METKKKKKKRYKESMKQKPGSYNKPLANLTKMRREKTQINKLEMKRG
jgi:hypothetical protein